MLTSYPVTSYGASIIISLTPDVSDDQALQFARDLNAGFRIELPSGVSMARTGTPPTPFTVWPAKSPVTTEFSSLLDD